MGVAATVQCRRHCVLCGICCQILEAVHELGRDGAGAPVLFKEGREQGGDAAAGEGRVRGPVQNTV